MKVYFAGFEECVEAVVFGWTRGTDGPITLMEKTMKKVDEAGRQYVYHVYELPRLAGFKTDL